MNDIIEGDSYGGHAGDVVSGGGDAFADAKDGVGPAAAVVSCRDGHDTVLADGADRVSLTARSFVNKRGEKGSATVPTQSSG